MPMLSSLADFAFYSSMEPQIALRISIGLPRALLFAPTPATFVQPFLAFLTETMAPFAQFRSPLIGQWSTSIAAARPGSKRKKR
jgi:hypothetical protein